MSTTTAPRRSASPQNRSICSLSIPIALRTGAWVVPAMVLRGPEHDTIIRPIMAMRTARYEATGDEEQDVLALTRLIVSALEPQLREHPELWYCFHPVWPDVHRRAEEAALAPER